MKKIFKKPELVCPAGNWSSMKTAVVNGADAVYFGVKGINMRNRAVNFDIEEINKITQYLHGNNKKGYLTLNTIICNKDLEKTFKIMQAAKKYRVDAVILWDLAVLSMAKELDVPFHVSTQASVSNIEAFKFYSNLGAKRIVLARECSIEDIKNIKKAAEKENLNCEIETFIHGAMCVSISGRCFMSQYSFASSANKGECLQPCRREYVIKDVQEGIEYIIGKDYVLSPKDLCTIDFIDRLIETKIDSFKIEGRMRPAEYGKIVISSYRQAIDLYFSSGFSKEEKNRLKDNLKQVYNRGFSDGFYFGRPNGWESGGLEHRFKKEYLGIVKKFYKNINVAEILIENKGVKKGDAILFTGKNTPAEFTEVKEMQKNHSAVKKALKGEEIGIKLPFRVRKNDKIFLWVKR